MLSTKATGSEFSIYASGKASCERRRDKDGPAMAGSSAQFRTPKCLISLLQRRHSALTTADARKL